MKLNVNLPIPYPKQREAIWSPKRFSVIEASTKAGKSSGCLFWLLERCFKDSDPTRNYWWIGPVFPQAEVIFNRLCSMIRTTDPEHVAWKANQSKMYVEIAGCGRIWFKSGDNPDSLYGEDVWAVVVDEATRCSEQVWHAVRSVLTATRGPGRIIGNVRGRINWVRTLKAIAERGDDEVDYHKITCWDAVEAGILSRKEVEDARAQLPDAVFRELYECEPADDGGNPFGIQHIRECIAPLTGQAPMVWGVDLAKGARTGDQTVCYGLDSSGRACAVHAFCDGWEQVETRVAEIIGQTPALMDNTGVGAVVVDRLMARGHPVMPFTYTNSSKQRLMGTLAAAIRQHRVTFPDGETVKQLSDFQYEYSEKTGAVLYSAPSGFHDDYVNALALAVFHHETCGRVTISGGAVEPAPRVQESAFAMFDRLRSDPDWGFN